MAVELFLDSEHAALVGLVKYRVKWAGGTNEFTDLDDAIAWRDTNQPTGAIYEVNTIKTVNSYVDDFGVDTDREDLLEVEDASPIA